MASATTTATANDSGDARSGPSQTYLWRVMGRGGLQKSEIPLFSQFENAWDKITN